MIFMPFASSDVMDFMSCWFELTVRYYTDKSKKSLFYLKIITKRNTKLEVYNYYSIRNVYNT